jgi:hypothetical protein
LGGGAVFDDGDKGHGMLTVSSAGASVSVSIKVHLGIAAVGKVR